MHIIYSGGWDHKSKKSINESILFRYYKIFKNAVKKGKKIAVVTLGKEDGFFNDVISQNYLEISDIIDRQKQNVDWNQYDIIVILGGVAKDLYDHLIRLHFSLAQLKASAIVIGDSAGSYVLSSYFFQSPPGPLRGIEIEFYEGLNPEANIITIGHKNNSVYCNDILIEKVNAFAHKKRLSVLIFEENEQKFLKEGKLININEEILSYELG